MIISFIGSRWPYQSAFENCTRQTDHELHHLLIDHITDHDLDHLDAIAVATRYCTQDLDPTDPTLMNMCATSRSCRYHPDKHVLDHADPMDPKQKKDLDTAVPVDPTRPNVCPKTVLYRSHPGKRVSKSRGNQIPLGQTCIQELSLHHVAHTRETLRTRTVPHRSQGR